MRNRSLKLILKLILTFAFFILMIGAGVINWFGEFFGVIVALCTAIGWTFSILPSLYKED